MKVSLVEPLGYCSGVKNAINIALKAKNDNPESRVIIFGKLVHNNFVVDYLKKKRIDYINQINDINVGDVVVLTAHGHTKALEELLVNKKIKFYDATCPKVKQNIKLINDEIASNHDVIYVGMSSHPETESALSQDKRVYIYDVKQGCNFELINDDSPAVINQTTLNINDLTKIHTMIRKAKPNARFYNEICAATRLRQEEVTKISQDTDLIVIVGDSISSNTNRLYEIAAESHKNSKIFMASSVVELKSIDLKNIKKAAICSGASTPKEIIDSIYTYLKNY